MPMFTQEDAEAIAAAIGVEDRGKIKRLRIDLNVAAEWVVPGAQSLGRGLPPGRAVAAAKQVQRAADQLIKLLQPLEAMPDEPHCAPSVLPALVWALAEQSGVRHVETEEVPAARQRLLDLKDDLRDLCRAAGAAVEARKDQVVRGRGGRRHRGDEGLPIVMPLLLDAFERATERPAATTYSDRLAGELKSTSEGITGPAIRFLEMVLPRLGWRISKPKMRDLIRRYGAEPFRPSSKPAPD